MTGWALSIEGFPYLLATQAITSLPTVAAGGTSGPDDTADWSTDWTLAQGTLAPPKGSFYERVAPIDGTLDVGQMAFQLYDRLAASGPYAGKRIITWGGTRTATAIANTPLSLSMSSSDTTFKLLDPTVLSVPCVAWCEQEALHVTAYNSGTQTFTCTRGYYATRALGHTADAGAVAAVVWSDFPNFERRRVCLYYVDASNVATPIWRGYCFATPRYKGGGGSGGGSGGSKDPSYELQCEHAWTRQRDLPLGLPPAQTEVRGFDSNAINAWIVPPSSVTQAFYSFSSRTYSAPGISSQFDTLEGCLSYTGWRVFAAISAYDSAHGTSYAGANYSNITLGQSGGGIAFRVQENGLGTLTIGLRIGEYGETIDAPQSADPRTAEARAEVEPAVLQAWPVGIAGQIIPITSAANIPTSGTYWAGSSYSDEGQTTKVRPVLRGPLSGDRYLVIEPVSFVATDNPYVTGTVRVKQSASDGDAGTSVATVTQRCLLAITARVESTHWATAVRRLFDTTYTTSAADARDWDFGQYDSTLGRTVRDTAGGFTQRVYYLNGAQTLAGILKDALPANGCGLAVRRSRLALVPFKVPLQSDAAAATFTSTDYRKGTAPTYSTMPGVLVNVCKVSSPVVNVITNDERSLGQYGPARTVELTLSGVDETLLRTPNPVDIMRYAMQRTVGLWSQPVKQVTLPLSFRHLTSVFLGDVVRFDAYNIPDGLGGIGLSAQAAFVVGRNVDFDNAAINLDVVVFDAGSLAGYAPAVRVASISGTVTINVATSYLGQFTHAQYDLTRTATDYAGSNLAGYAGTSGDGGTSFWAAGMRGKLVVRDDTSDPPISQAVTVSAVNVAAKTITASASIPTIPNNWPSLALTNIVDFIPDAFDTAGLTSTQKQFAYVASESTGKIGASSTAARKWSP